MGKKVSIMGVKIASWKVNAIKKKGFIWGSMVNPSQTEWNPAVLWKNPAEMIQNPAVSLQNSAEITKKPAVLLYLPISTKKEGRTFVRSVPPRID
ncbi:hypothetical protein [Rossellomorea aquimaris]|uniref:hypothetical protein n=1 Tax=Rossellomorea aquimaris TaxID=189382 RepID=UPI0005CAFF5C|nr:hypothetical protein [Rossellomorea aquimaris]